MLRYIYGLADRQQTDVRTDQQKGKQVDALGQAGKQTDRQADAGQTTDFKPTDRHWADALEQAGRQTDRPTEKQVDR